MKLKALAWLIVLAAVTGGCVLAPRVSATQPVGAHAEVKRDLAAEVSARVQREMESKKIVGLAVALARGGTVVHTAGFGMEDRDAGVPVTDATMFRWASISKPLTAVAAMQLVKEGKLDLDADVRTYVHEFPEKPHTITTRQLLCHQGGIVHYSNGKVVKTERKYAAAHPFKDVVTALDKFRESPLVCEPGTKHSYTTHGYMLAGAVVERAAKKPFAEVVRERIAAPLGMTTLRPDYQWETIDHRTKGYRRGKTGEFVNSTDTDVSWKLAGGGWTSTVGDLARFGAGMLGDKLVDAKTRAAMWEDQKTWDGTPTGYGLGFGVKQREERVEISHSGAQEKAATLLLIWPDAVVRGQTRQGVVVALMCNTEDTNLRALADDLAKLLAETAPIP